MDAAVRSSSNTERFAPDSGGGHKDSRTARRHSEKLEKASSQNAATKGAGREGIEMRSTVGVCRIEESSSESDSRRV